MVNGEKFQSHAPTLTLTLTLTYFYILKYVQVSSGLNHYFLSYHDVCTQTDRQTDRHTDGHEYSIVVVDKLQL